MVDTTGGSKSQLELLVRQNQQKLKEKSSSSSATAATTANANGESCQCRCLPYLNTYREDLGICVDDIHGELLKALNIKMLNQQANRNHKLFSGKS